MASHAFERAGSLAAHDQRRAALLAAAADAAWLGGLGARATGLLEAARQLAPPVGVAAAIEHVRGQIAAATGSVSEAQRILLDGAELADPERAVMMLAEAVTAGFYAGDAAAMRDAAARIPVIQGASARTAFFAAMARGMALIFGGEEGGSALVREAVALVEGSDALSSDSRVLAWAALGPLWLREAEAGRALIARALEVARTQTAIGVLPFLLSHVAVDPGHHGPLGGGRGRVLRGDRVGARDRPPHGSRVRTGAPRRAGGAAGARAGVPGARGGGAGPRQEHAALDALGVGDPDLSPVPELVELDLRRGEPERAAARLATFAPEAHAKGQPRALARAGRCRGLLADDDEVDAAFADALAWHAQTADAYETARTQLAYGSRLRRARRRVQARGPLRQALATFENLGASPWEEAARVELAATGETARRRDHTTRDQLTPQELQIAMLLAGGRTTREAATALFLSPKTIEYHLRGVYRKLEVGSREELAAAMGGSGGAAAR